MAAQQWLATLNERVFFWLHPRRLDQLLNARRNRGRPHDILVIDTASLVGAHHRRIQLSAINSGATLYPNAPQRGTRTFQTIEDYTFTQRLHRRTPQAAVVELAVPCGVRLTSTRAGSSPPEPVPASSTLIPSGVPWAIEDGRSAGKPVNQAAARLAQSFGWQLNLLGLVVIAGLDKNADRPTNLSQDQASAILRSIASAP